MLGVVWTNVGQPIFQPLLVSLEVNNWANFRALKAMVAGSGHLRVSQAGGLKRRSPRFSACLWATQVVWICLDEVVNLGALRVNGKAVATQEG